MNKVTRIIIALWAAGIAIATAFPVCMYTLGGVEFDSARIFYMERGQQLFKANLERASAPIGSLRPKVKIDRWNTISEWIIITAIALIAHLVISPLSVRYGTSTKNSG